MKYIFLIFIFIRLVGTTVHAQQVPPQAELISGRVVSAKDSTAGMAFVQVYNKASRKGTTTNADGGFRIMARLSDSIEFRMIGYVDTTLNIYQLRELGFTVPMKERVYKLQQLNVRANRLKQPFAPAEPSKDPYVGYRSVKPSGRSRQEDQIGLGTSTMGGGAAVTGAITALANKFNKNEKQRVKIRALKEKENEEKYYKALYEYWFDPEVVTEITGLTGPELKRFLAFCKPSLAFLEEANEYQVILAIQRYHRQFKNINRY